jgi:hypothetical protein
VLLKLDDDGARCRVANVADLMFLGVEAACLSGCQLEGGRHVRRQDSAPEVQTGTMTLSGWAYRWGARSWAGTANIWKRRSMRWLGCSAHFGRVLDHAVKLPRGRPGEAEPGERRRAELLPPLLISTGPGRSAFGGADRARSATPSLAPGVPGDSVE